MTGEGSLGLDEVGPQRHQVETAGHGGVVEADGPLAGQLTGQGLALLWRGALHAVQVQLLDLVQAAGLEQGALQQEVGVFKIRRQLQRLAQQLLAQRVTRLLVSVDAGPLEDRPGGLLGEVLPHLLGLLDERRDLVLPGVRVVGHRLLEVHQHGGVRSELVRLGVETLGLVRPVEIHGDRGQLCHQRGARLGFVDQLGLELHQLGDHVEVTHLAVDLPRAHQRQRILREELERLLVVDHGLVFAEQVLLIGLAHSEQLLGLLLLVLDLVDLALNLFEDAQWIAGATEAQCDLVHRFPIQLPDGAVVYVVTLPDQPARAFCRASRMS